ncbi:MAG TPA: hypothetical protein VK949_03360 [Methylotenera sp.]|nr:hypothetical protein [Methylotenera sp.]
MKFSFIALSFLAISSNSYAFECNTVMGGCPTDVNAGTTSSHMRSEIVNKIPSKLPAAVAPASPTKTTASPSNSTNKKAQGSLIQTINKNVLK